LKVEEFTIWKILIKALSRSIRITLSTWISSLKIYYRVRVVYLKFLILDWLRHFTIRMMLILYAKEIHVIWPRSFSEIIISTL